MYRAMTLMVLSQGIPFDDVVAIGRLAEKTKVQLLEQKGMLRVLLNDEDVTEKIRTQEVTKAVSAISAIPKVREVMVREQRRMGTKGGIVLEGRDIGTVVFPNADLKIFMVASIDERARRRKKDLKAQGVEVAVHELVREIGERDRKDSERTISPLQKANDAIVLDTSDLTIEDQAELIVQKAKEILEKRK